MTKTNRIKAVKKTVYRCSICGMEYNDREKAEEACGSYELELPQFKVGEHVLVYFNGDTRIARVATLVGPIVGNKTPNGVRQYFSAAHVYKYSLKPIRKTLGNTMEDATFWTSELTRRSDLLI